MKNLFTKIKTKSFWVSLVAGVILILQTLGIRVDVPYVNEIVEAVCALLVVLGVFTAPPPAADGEMASQDDSPSVPDDTETKNLP